MRDPTLPVPQLIGATIGNYRIVSLLGEGGMGAVYLAEHPLIGKRVAIKVLHEEFARDPDAVARFFGEARAVNEIGHPNIVDVIDFGQAGNFCYLIMEYLDGRSLARTLRAGAMEPSQAFTVAAGIADALSASHERGIVHRDLKPDNVFLIARGKDPEFVKVLDFGIAKLTHGGVSSARTRTGVVLGTPAYMSPEQCDGRGRVDARSDVYALGVVLFEMLTGQTPFSGEGWGELLIQHLTAAPPRPSLIRPDLSAAIDAVVLRCLEKAPEARFQSMAELRAALTDPAAYAAGVPLVIEETMPSWVGRVDAMARDTGRRTPTTLSAAAGERRTTGQSRAEQQRRAGLTVGVVCGVIAAAVGVFVAIKASETGSARPTPGPAAPGPAVDPVPGPSVPAPDPGTDPGTAAPDPGTAAPDPGTVTDLGTVAPETVSVTITTSVPGARVFIDGRAAGPAGTPIMIPRGDEPITISVRARGYRTLDRTITPSRDFALDVILEKKRTVTTPGQSCPADDPDCVLAPR